MEATRMSSAEVAARIDKLHELIDDAWLAVMGLFTIDLPESEAKHLAGEKIVAVRKMLDKIGLRHSAADRVSP
jgi:hypothetical protein